MGKEWQQSAEQWREGGGRMGGGGNLEGREGVRQTWGSGLCVVCEDLCPSARGSVCTASKCVSAFELGFALLTSCTFPPVTKGKYIHTAECTVMQPRIQTSRLHAARTMHNVYLCIVTVCRWF